MDAAYDFMPDEGNPLDLVEDLASANNWLYERDSDDDLQIKIPGKWCDITVFVHWQEEFSAVLICCEISEIQTSEELTIAMSDLLQDINQQLWLGHFDLSPEKKTPSFRYTALMRDLSLNAKLSHIEDVLDIAISEINRFFPVIQMTSNGQLQDNRVNLSTAMLQTVGEA